MKIFLASDIHTEAASRRFDPTFDYESLRFDYPDDADVIVLAGDIGEWTNGLEWARHRFKRHEIIYVAGNHEHYDSDLATVDELRLKARELNIHYLENDSVIINDIRFLGCTLWTDFDNYSAEEVNRVWSTMNDYKYIYCRPWWSNDQNREEALQLMQLDSLYGFDPTDFSPTVAYLLHKRSLNWLQQQLDQPYTGQTVVVIHHAPTLRSTDNTAYGSDLTQFIKKNAGKITLWCHGHIHKSVDYEISSVRIVCNARGYPTSIGLSRSFDAKKLICL